MSDIIITIIINNESLIYLNNRIILKYVLDNIKNSGLFKEENIYLLYQNDCSFLDNISGISKYNVPLNIKDNQKIMEGFLNNFNDEQIIFNINPCAIFIDKWCLKETIDQFLDYGSIKSCESFNNQEFENNIFFIARKKDYFNNQYRLLNLKSPYTIEVKDKDNYLKALGYLSYDYARYKDDFKLAHLQNYRELSKLCSSKKIIVGDSRMYGLNIKDYFNYSINGVSLNSFKDAIKFIKRNEIEKMVLSLGINDFHYGYNLEDIKKTFVEVFEQFQNIELCVTTIVYSLNRMSLDNDVIKKLNDFIFSQSEIYNYQVIDLNPIICQEESLKYEYSFDGLHFNYKAYQLIINYLNQVL